MRKQHQFVSAVWCDYKSEINNQELKDFAYQKKLIDSGVLISNFNGWQSNNLINENNFSLKTLISILNNEISKICDDTQLPTLKLSNIWFNINYPNGFNTLHDHPGSVFSGVYYVEATEDQGNIVFERTDNAQYFLPTVRHKNSFNSTSFAYKSVTSALYIFPSWLKHRVEPNNTNFNRISISFNYSEDR